MPFVTAVRLWRRAFFLTKEVSSRAQIILNRLMDLEPSRKEYCHFGERQPTEMTCFF
jgi:hypothetical protein